ncbi:MAG: ABC transporter substrate-binding protein [Patescibacteria group bacterium]|nr:ABC transporter substrate-binding protein [Patescibacteria group bacterium]
MSPNFTFLEKALLTVALVAVVLCGSFLGYRIYTDHTYLAPDSGGTYREAQIGQPHIPNPLFCSNNSTDQDICALVFSGLTRFDSEKQRVVPDVATDWQVSKDNRSYTFHLNHKATWHDGKPVTTDDVIFTYGTVIGSPEYNGPYAGVFKDVKIEKVDDYTFIFRLPRQEAFFLRDTTIGLLPAHLLLAEPISHLENSTFNQKPVGCGPYSVTSMSASEIQLSRHNGYHGAKPFIDNIVLNFYPDISALRQDMRRILNIKSVPVEMKQDFTVDLAFKTEEIELPQYVALFFNTDRTLTKYRQIRIALRSFIDMNQVLEKVGEARILPDPIFVRDKTNIQTGSGSYFDPKAGEKALLDIGWKKGEDGYFVIERKDADGNSVNEPLSLRLLTADRSEFRAVSEAIASLWKKAGVKVEVDVRSGEKFLGALAARDYDVLLYGESIGRDLDYYPFWHSSQITFPGLNLSQYANLEVDRLLTQVRQTFDGNVQGEELLKIRDLLLNDVPAVWLYTPTYTFVHETSLKGVNLDGISDLSDRFKQLADKWYLQDQVKWRWKS